MDYEKKIREYLNSSEVDQLYKSMLLNLFPELKESNDERIRKAIVNVFKTHCDYEVYFGVSVTDILAWLEKQGSKNHQKEIDDAYLRGISDAKHEIVKQGEKKSIESTKTKLNESMIKPDPNPYWTLAPEYKLMKKQKPAEWSEEDKEMSRFIGNAITVDDSYEYLKSKGIEVIDAHVWLDELKDRVQPQPKQEWSEEDSPYYDDICELLMNILHSESRNYNMEAIKKDLEWLKSLSPRSHWKPSDEQMRELSVAKNSYFDLSYKTKDTLKSLYNDLKKLKG